MKGSLTLLWKTLGVHIFLVIIAIGIKSHPFVGPDLTWNMILAVAALDLAVLAYYVKQPLLRIGISGLWLFFYPNTFYMLTDIRYMWFAEDFLYNHDSMILYMLYVPSILFGVICGLESVRVMLSIYRLPSVLWRYIFYIILSFVSSFAIHIGRYARLNSWDIFTRPLTVVNELLAVISWDAFYFVVGFTCIQIMCLYVTDTTKTLED